MQVQRCPTVTVTLPHQCATKGSKRVTRQTLNYFSTEEFFKEAYGTNAQQRILIPISQSSEYSHFQGYLQHFVLVKLATSSVRVKDLESKFACRSLSHFFACRTI